MKLFRRFSTFVLMSIIGIITFRFIFFISYLELQKESLRNTAISENNSEILLLKINSEDIYTNRNNLEWKENNKELVINGAYFEVVSIQSFKGYYLVSVIEDKKENALLKDFFCMNNGLEDDLENGLNFFFDLDFLDVKNHLRVNLDKDDNLFIPEKSNFYAFQFYPKKINPPEFNKSV